MYGMIHLALRGMITERFGPSAWDDVERGAGSGPAHMVSASVYPDEITGALITAAAERANLDAATFLQEFGIYWIAFVDRGCYAPILKFTGGNLAEFIGNLDRMHHSLLSSMPEARMPSFRLVEQSQHELLVDYVSTRSGMEQLAVGLFHGLIRRFGLTGEVTIEPGPSGCTRLRLRLDEALPA